MDKCELERGPRSNEIGPGVPVDGAISASRLACAPPDGRGRFPVNAPRYLGVMSGVENIDETLKRLASAARRGVAIALRGQ